MDNVELVLISQKGLVSAFDERIKRAMQSLDAELQQLDLVRRKLEADLKDKVRRVVNVCVGWKVGKGGRVGPGQALAGRRRFPDGQSQLGA